MSTSGSISFTQTRDQLITDTLMLLGVVGSGETAGTNDINLCSNILNKMLKGWESMGIHLWTESQGILYLNNNQAKYTLVSSGGDFASDGTGTPEITTLNGAGSGSAIIVVSTTGMSTNDNIGICLDNNTIQWTTISSIVGTTVNLNASLTSAASSGNTVYTFTSQCPKPLSIQNAQLRDNNNFDRPVKIINRQEYRMIPQKTLTGQPVVLYYSPQLSNGLISLWPAPSAVNYSLHFTYLRTIQDLVSGTDNFDLPQEWLEAITYNLAVRLAPAYGISLTTSGLQGNPGLVSQAAEYLEALKAWDAEQPYVQIIPNDRYKN